jgi:hypothetical protein
VVTPLNHSLRYPTRSNLQGLVDSLPEPERVYRRRINKLAPRRLLESLGEETIFDIHLLFAHNNPTTTNPTTTMGDPLSPCNFANIQGYPHLVPDKVVEKLPASQGNNDVSARSHIVNFNMCILKWCNGHDYEDVKMKPFVYSLEGEVLEWFMEHDDNKFSTLATIQKSFNERWGDQKEDRNLLASLSSSQKKENETMEEFNKIYNDLVKSLPQTIKPHDASILIHYMESFEGEIRYQLRDKEPTTPRDAQQYAIKIDKNMQDARKSNLSSFSREISYKPIEERKKKVENQESYNDGIKELTQLIKKMEVNQANHIKKKWSLTRLIK